MPHRRSNARIARAVLIWFGIFFVAAQLALVIAQECCYPEVADPEFAKRLGLLQDRLRESPDRPLLLLIGSSRTAMNFVPEVLPPLTTPEGRHPLVFNFSHLGAGPAMNLVVLRRLLRAGVRPDSLVLEIMPSQLGDNNQNLIVQTAGAADLPAVCRLTSPIKTCAIFCRSRLVPWYRNRLFVMRNTLPDWVPPEAALPQDKMLLGPLGGDDGWQLRDSLPPEEIRRRTDATRASYQPALASFRLAPLSVRSMHEALRLARERHIPVTLLISPESSEFRGWYPPAVWEQIETFSQQLARDYNLPLIDARTWLPDDEFTDGHHVLRPGAQRFTLRLGEKLGNRGGGHY